MQLNKFLSSAKKYFGALPLLMLLALIVSSCAPAAITPTVTDTSLPATSAPTQATTPAPTASDTPTQTPQPSNTQAPTETLTPSPTPVPGPVFDNMRVTGLVTNTYGVMATVELPGVSQNYKLELGSVPYSCTFDAQYADKLFCQGIGKPVLNQPISVIFRDFDTGEVVYTSTTEIPALLFATAVPDYNTYNDCPQRGQNVSCETECRIAPDGNPCIVASCTDACGAYFSVQTCPNMDMNFSSCSPEQWAEMKSRYSIP